MTLRFEVRQFVVTGYRAAVLLEDRLAEHRKFPDNVAFDDAVQAVRLPTSDEEQGWESLALHDVLRRWRPTMNVQGVDWVDVQSRALAFLRQSLPKAIGSRLRDRIDALLLLLLVDQQLQGRKFFLVGDYATWLGLSEADVEEVVRSEALRGLVKIQADGLTTAAQLTVDGQLRAEGLLEPEATPGSTAPVVARPSAGPERVEGVIERIALQNILSFGHELETVELGRLNILIGPNGSGKSNLLAAIAVLASTPRDLRAGIQREGGIHDLLWKGAAHEGLVGSLEAVVRFSHREMPLRHQLRVTVESDRFRVAEERIENAEKEGRAKALFFFGYELQGPMISVRDSARSRRIEPLHLASDRSILAERRDPERFPELADLASFYEGVRAYREPLIGRLAAVRRPQPSDLPNDSLLEDGSNLALVLNRLRLDPSKKRAIVERLRDVYASVRDIDTKVEGGTIQLFLEDDGFSLPASRLSDGTLRFLAVLAILGEVSPAPVVLLEEPELGLHPDAIGAVAELLRDASQRTQLIVTTHSVALVDRFTSSPEDVQIVEKLGTSTRFHRLARNDLKEWLAKFSLGELWRMGELGGNRW